MKTKLFKLTSLVLCIMMCVCLFAACGKEEAVKSTASYNDPTEDSLSSGEYTKTEDFTLSWDDEKKCVLLLDKKSNTYWSSIPYSYYTETEPEGIGMVRMHSPIFVEYVVGQEIKTAYALVEAINNGYVIASECENGLRVTYYMPNFEISIPVEYTLCDDGLKVSLVISDICENENLVYNVSVSPFMCSAKNNTEDSYLFVPSGSGTLMYVDDKGRNSRAYHDLVYGTDYATTIEEKIVNKENISMPVYGAKQGNNAICAVITEGAEIAQINAEAGNEEYGYSAVWSTFLVRGINSLYVKDYQGYQSQISIATNDVVSLDKASVVFTPLSGEKANYMGMAEVYRNYLKDNYKIEKDKDFSTIYLKMLGGTLVSKNVLGIKTEELKVSTSYDDAKEIISEIKETTGVTPVVQMTGYGKYGLDIRKIAGGFKLSGDFGSVKNFIKYCNSEDVSLYFDFDILHYSKGGSGISRYSDAATTVNKAIAKQYYFSPANYKRLTKNDFYYTVKREKIQPTANKLIKYLNKCDINGVSLSALSSTSYSGYPDKESYNKNGFETIVENVLESAKKAKKSVMASYAFDYAAVAADCIVESATKSSQNDGFDKDIPFYQIVMKGITPTAVSAINLAIDTQEQFLKAIETGSSLSFSLCSDWNDDYASSKQSVFQFALYDTWKSTVVEMIKASEEFLSNVSDEEIKSHKEISSGVYCTEFSNGTKVCVNYNDKKVATPIGQVEADSFKYVLAGG